MAAGSISLRINRFRRSYGFFRGGFKALVLLGMCGGIYYLSQLPQVEYLLEGDQLTEDNFVFIDTSSPPQIESIPEVVQLSENFDHPGSSNQDECKLNEDQLSADNFDIITHSSSFKGESIQDEVYATSIPPQVESIPKEVRLTKENFELNVTSSSPEAETKQDLKEKVDLIVTSSPSKDESIQDEVNATCSSPQVESIPEVVQLTKENFELLVTSSLEPWLVEFYAPWCPHCKKFANNYDNIAERLWGVVNVGKVNGAEEKSLKNQFGVKGFPTFLFFHLNKTSPILYRGPRTEDSIVEMVLGSVL